MIDKIKIGWKEYDIDIYESELSDENNKDVEIFGDMNPKTGKIRLTNKYGQETLESTLIHEVLHAIDDMYGVGLTENAVEALGNGIYTVLKDNDLKITKK